MDTGGLYESEEDIILVIDNPESLCGWLDSQHLLDIEDDMIINLLSGPMTVWKTTQELTVLLKCYVKWSIDNGVMEESSDQEEKIKVLRKSITDAKIKNAMVSGIRSSSDGYVLDLLKNGTMTSKKLTNFIFKNIRRADTPDGDKLIIVDVLCKGVLTRDIVIPGDKLVKIQELRPYIRKRSSGTIEQEISPREFQAIIDHIDDMPFKSMKTLQYLGCHYGKDGNPYMTYLTNKEDTEQKVIDSIGLGDVPEVYFRDAHELDVKFHYPHSDEEQWKAVVRKMLENALHLNDFNRMCTIMAWFLASCLRHLPDKPNTDYNFRFPILNVVGTPGSGKTTVMSTMAKMLGYNGGGASFTKPFTVIKNLAESISHFHWIDEYKVDSKVSREASTVMASLLRRAYDSGLEERGTSDQRKITYYLRTPVVVSGESAFSDQALLERSVSITFSKQETEQLYKNSAYYDNIIAMKNSEINLFARGYWDWLLSNHTEWENWLGDAYDRVRKLKTHAGLNERSFKSAIWIMFGLDIMERLSNLSGSSMRIDDKVKNAVVEGILSDGVEIQKKESLSGELLEFLADEWYTGHLIDSTTGRPTVIVQPQTSKATFHKSVWIEKFRRHCITSAKGQQSKDILTRTLYDLQLQGCVHDIDVLAEMGGVRTRCFKLDLEKVEQMYGVPLDIWTSTHKEGDSEI